MFEDIFIELFYAIFIDLTVIGKVGNQSCQTVLSLQDINLIVQCFYLLTDELCDIDRLFFIIDIQLPVFAYCFIVQFLLIGFEHAVQFFYYLLLVLKELVVDALSQSDQIVKYFIIAFIEFFKDDDMLVTLLLRLGDDFLQVDVGGLVVLKEVLFGVLDNAVGTQRHQAFAVAAKICQKFVGMVCAVDFSYLAVLGKSSLVYSRHCVRQSNRNNNNQQPQ